MDKEGDLHTLKNLGAASVNILRAIGIHHYDDLQRLGAVKTYLKIQKRGIRVSKVMLYALEGALLDIHWKELDPAVKHRLLAEVESLEESIP